MKRLFIYASLLAAVFTACDPIEDRNDNMGGAITADQLIVSATPLVVNGVRSNKIIVENNSPCLSHWEYTKGASAKAYDELIVSEVGDLVISFTGLNADGSKITKDLPINVEAIIFQPTDMDRFFGNGTWVFDKFTNEITLNDVEGVYPYGTTIYGEKAPTTNGFLYGEFDESDAEFSFSFKEGTGSVFSRTLADGTKQTGTFSFDLTKTIGDWSLGTVTMKGATIPYPYAWDKKGGTAYKFYILALDDDQIVLATAADNKVVDNPAGQTINVWMFRPEGWIPKGAEEQMEMITDGESAVWTWDEKEARVWGNGAYLVSPVADWWGVPIDDVEGQTAGDGKGATMTFSMDGTMVKTKVDGSTTTGTFMINMNKVTKKENSETIWAIGKIKTDGVTILNPKVLAGADAYTYDIISITDEKMTLANAVKGSGSWGEAYYWMFKKK